jgi:predicted metal-dependent peptidase
MGMYDSADDLIMKARCRLVTMHVWYGTMASLMEWKRDDKVGTMGVRMIAGGRVECRWSGPFVDAIGEIDALMAVIQHEIEHIVRLHITRHGARDHEMANTAADMCVNGPESKPNIENLPMIPVFDEGGNKTTEAPPLYFPEGDLSPENNSTYEEVYDWLDKNQKKIFIDMPGGDLASGKKKPKPGQKVISGTTVDNHDIWEESEIGEEETRQIVKDMVEQASKKAGSAPGHLKDAIEQLQDPKVNWKYLFRQFCGRQLGGKRKTFARRNRRIDLFGFAGRSNHASVPLLLAVDVSSSVASNVKMLEQLFTEVEAASHRFKISLVLWDAKIQMPAKRYHRGDWRKIPAKGGCGTNVVHLFAYLKENHLFNNILVVLTDGQVGRWPPEVPPTPVVWLLTEDAKPPFGDKILISL